MARRKPGQIVQINLGQGLKGVGIVLEEPLIAFYDKVFKLGEEIPIGNINRYPIAFTVMVMNRAITKRIWPVIGHIEIPKELRYPPKFCKKDDITGKISVYHEIPELAPYFERPATVDECRQLEAAAVWEPEHVEDRLRDHCSHTPNKWVEQLKVR